MYTVAQLTVWLLSLIITDKVRKGQSANNSAGYHPPPIFFFFFPFHLLLPPINLVSIKVAFLKLVKVSTRKTVI